MGLCRVAKGHDQGSSTSFRQLTGLDSSIRWIPKQLIELLEGEDAQTALRLLHRYTNHPLRKNPKPWRAWYQENKERLKFSDERGYRFILTDPKSTQQKVSSRFQTQYGSSPQELTEISPVLFDQGLVALHVIDGVAHQYKGRKVTMVLRARVKPEWHFHSTTEDNGTNIPTSMEVTLPDGMELENEWVHPKGKDDQLTDGATFQRVIRVGDQPHDRVLINGSM